MKKKLLITTVVSTTLLTGCSNSVQQTFDPSKNDGSAVSGQPTIEIEEYKPEDNIADEVYGPPPMDLEPDTE